MESKKDKQNIKRNLSSNLIRKDSNNIRTNFNFINFEDNDNKKLKNSFKIRQISFDENFTSNNDNINDKEKIYPQSNEINVNLAKDKIKDIRIRIKSPIKKIEKEIKIIKIDTGNKDKDNNNEINNIINRKNNNNNNNLISSTNKYRSFNNLNNINNFNFFNNNNNPYNTNRNKSFREKFEEYKDISNKSSLINKSISSLGLIKIQNTYIVEDKKSEKKSEKEKEYKSEKEKKFDKEIEREKKYERNFYTENENRLKEIMNKDTYKLKDNKEQNKDQNKIKKNKSTNILNSIKINFISGESNLNFPVIPDEIIREKSCKSRNDFLLPFTSPLNSNGKIINNFYSRQRRKHSEDIISNKNLFIDGSDKHSNKENKENLNKMKNKNLSLDFENAFNYFPSGYYMNFLSNYDKDGSLIYKYNNFINQK